MRFGNRCNNVIVLGIQRTNNDDRKHLDDTTKELEIFTGRMSALNTLRGSGFANLCVQQSQTTTHVQ